MDALLDEIERRWRCLFVTLSTGVDVPPSQRLRVEGMMEAAALQGAASRDELLASMDRCYREVFGRAISEDVGSDWARFFPFPEIPAMARRAPVYPSTKG